MDTKSLSVTELTDILEKIEAVLIEAGLPKGSVEIEFKSNSEFELGNTFGSLLNDQITSNFTCYPCGGGGTIGGCCSFQ